MAEGRGRREKKGSWREMGLPRTLPYPPARYLPREVHAAWKRDPGEEGQPLWQRVNVHFHGVHVCTNVYKNLDTQKCVEAGEKIQTQR